MANRSAPVPRRSASPSHARSTSRSIENRSARNSTDNCGYCTRTSWAQTEYHPNTYSRSLIPTYMHPAGGLQEPPEPIDIHGPSRITECGAILRNCVPRPCPPLPSRPRRATLTLYFLVPRERRSGQRSVSRCLFGLSRSILPRAGKFLRVAE
jgi:hypothetical protein